MASKNQGEGRWMFLLCALVFGGYLASGLLPPVACYYYGKETTATVTKYAPREDDHHHRVHDHVFQYDGHSSVRRLSKQYPVGHKRQMLYLVDRPSWVVTGSKDDLLFDVIDQNTNDTGLWILSVITIICCLATLVSWKAHFRSKRQAE